VIDIHLISQRKLRVLLVESHAFQLFDLQSLFYDLGCHYLTSVMSQAEFERTLADTEHRFDLAVCGCGAFDLDDQALAQVLCASGRVDNLIMTTGGDLRQYRALSHQLRAQGLPLLGFMQKPLLPEAMRSMLEEVLDPALSLSA
jgi:hypothetical protein